MQGFHYKINDFLENFIIINSNEDEFKKASSLLFDEGRKFLLDLQDAGKSISHLSYYDEHRNIYAKSSKNYFINTFFYNKNSKILGLKKPAFGSNKERNTFLVLKGYIDLKFKILILLNDKLQEETVTLCLKKLNVSYIETKDFNLDENYDVSISFKNLASGIELTEKNIVILTPNELFGYKRNKYTYSSKFKEGVVLGSYLELEKGDYVVHEYNGIGQFLGVTTLTVNGNHEDFLQILYANGDKIYVPLYQFNLIRKYVGKDGTSPRLSSLHSDKWDKTKKKIKQKVNDLALRLLDLYQTRHQVAGFKFEDDDEIQKNFEDEFEYELTPDQKKSLDEIKKDMESTYPMDRLLCGDVGFGKTEIAFRAAMKAILSGKQVAFLCPTTLLARQHYNVAMERFKNYGVRICLLSRMQKNEENKKNIEDISLGKIDLAIGTHKMLSKKVTFNNLGLLIIDEEQRFGVEQKEKIKEKTKNIDCLTLSATPIPRTLQTTLIGLKSVSTIETPPKERSAVQTYVIPYDEEVIKELIKREISRNGQIYYVFNSVERIYEKYRRLENLVPECRIGIVHGQMEKDSVEEVMNDFYSGNIDLLLATSIIENGIDVRNANLMLVENADHFGLAQLYQIKGRVGRGDKIAFAYLMISDNKKISDDGKKRLKAIQDFSELGSGYKIAQRDLLIRGAGDLLGPQQAGFIDEVGVDLYIKLLNESIEEQKTGIKKEDDKMNNASLSLDAYIPDEFANDDEKVELYQKIIECKNLAELEYFRKNTKDMYGNIPLSLENLLKKRKIDIYLNDNKDCFNKCHEEYNKVFLTLSPKFASINGIGTEIFKNFATMLNKINITYHNQILVIEVYKKEDWLNTLTKVMEIIIKLNNKYKDEL